MFERRFIKEISDSCVRDSNEACMKSLELLVVLQRNLVHDLQMLHNAKEWNQSLHRLTTHVHFSY